MDSNAHIFVLDHLFSGYFLLLTYAMDAITSTDNEPEIANPDCAPEVPNTENNDNVSSVPECDEEDQVKDRSAVSESPLPPSCSTAPEGGGSSLETPSSPQHPNPLKRKRESKGTVAFISVKVPATSSRS